MKRRCRIAGLAHPLRQRPGLRSATYLSSMVGVLWLSSRFPRNRDDPYQANIHLQAFPGVVALTNLFTWLHPERREAWSRPPTRAELADAARGMALGLAAISTVLGIARAKGWVSAPAWGWEAGSYAPVDVLASAALLTAQEGTVVFNEEQVFRGYGLDSLHEALGLPGALAVSIPLFARYHGPGLKRSLGLSAAGLLLALLRLRTGNLWLAAGFHLGWNVGQVAVFGPVEGAPSIRPLRIHGPPQWIGRPGHPDQGWLQIGATVVMVLLAGLDLWRARRRQAAQQHRLQREPGVPPSAPGD
jgi:membrane protease YdiL (CAAX protease family)